MMNEKYLESINSNKAMIKSPYLVFWFDAPPRASASVFRSISEKWENDVFYFCVGHIREERKKHGWQDANHGNAKIIILSDLENADEFIEKFINKNDAIHIINGFRSKTYSLTKKHLLLKNKFKIAAWSERPGNFGNFIERFLRKTIVPAIYRVQYLKYSSMIKVYFPLGLLGIEEFAKFGWDREIMYPFMYVPELNQIDISEKNQIKNGLVKFLYVGRFDNDTKGLDVLIKAFNNLPITEWSLSLVGGYGKNKDNTIAWAESHPNVEFLGTWPSDQVSKNMTEYDVCIVPSKYDGWNVTTNEAINAGIAIIASDEATSHELVEFSGAGLVFKAGRYDSLTEALRTVINNPEKLSEWKKRSKEYAILISPESVADYFISVLKYTFLETEKEKPSAPWIINHEHKV